MTHIKQRQMYGTSLGGDIHVLRPSKLVEFGHPLHVTSFYKMKERVHQRKQAARQNLILYLYDIWRNAMETRYPAAFLRIPMSLVSLRKAVYDYRVAFDFFFEVADTGYNFNDGAVADLSVVVPRVIDHPFFKEAHREVNVTYVPPSKPIDCVFSKCVVQDVDAVEVLARLRDSNLFHLIPPVQWLMSLTDREIEVHFSPTGKLQQRDMSVWPIRGMEGWPSWLRETMFGPGVDIEAAYNQFIMRHLIDIAPSENYIALVFPDLKAQYEDKSTWRKSLCTDLGLEVNETNLKIIKTLVMALANGSNISAGIINSYSPHSQAKNILEPILSEASENEREIVGERLGKIAKQFRAARKMVGQHMDPHKQVGKRATSMVFPAYFAWEREKRYEIWEAVGRYGLMTHDGIDGIPPHVLENRRTQLMELDVKVA